MEQVEDEGADERACQRHGERGPVLAGVGALLRFQRVQFQADPVERRQDGLLLGHQRTSSVRPVKVHVVVVFAPVTCT